MQSSSRALLSSLRAARPSLPSSSQIALNTHRSRSLATEAAQNRSEHLKQWSREEVQGVYDTPLFDLIYRAVSPLPIPFGSPQQLSQVPNPRLLTSHSYYRLPCTASITLPTRSSSAPSSTSRPVVAQRIARTAPSRPSTPTRSVSRQRSSQTSTRSSRTSRCLSDSSKKTDECLSIISHLLPPVFFLLQRSEEGQGQRLDEVLHGRCVEGHERKEAWL